MFCCTILVRRGGGRKLPGGDRSGKGWTHEPGRERGMGEMGYFASTSDTSGNCGLHILLEPRRCDTTASHRKQQREQFLGYTSASMVLHTPTQTQLAYARVQSQSLGKKNSREGFHAYVHRVPNAQCGRVGGPPGSPGISEDCTIPFPPPTRAPQWRGDEQRAQVRGGAKLSTMPHVLSASLVRAQRCGSGDGRK